MVHPGQSTKRTCSPYLRTCYPPNLPACGLIDAGTASIESILFATPIWWRFASFKLPASIPPAGCVTLLHTSGRCKHVKKFLKQLEERVICVFVKGSLQEPSKTYHQRVSTPNSLSLSFSLSQSVHRMRNSNGKSSLKLLKPIQSCKALLSQKWRKRRVFQTVWVPNFWSTV